MHPTVHDLIGGVEQSRLDNAERPSEPLGAIPILSIDVPCIAGSDAKIKRGSWVWNPTIVPYDEVNIERRIDELAGTEMQHGCPALGLGLGATLDWVVCRGTGMEYGARSTGTPNTLTDSLLR